MRFNQSREAKPSPLLFCEFSLLKYVSYSTYQKICCLCNWYWNSRGCGLFSGLCFSRSFEAKTPPLAPQHSDYNRVHSFKELGKEEIKTYVLSRKWFKFSHRNSFRFAKKRRIETKDVLWKWPICEKATVGSLVSYTVQTADLCGQSLKCLSFGVLTFSATRCRWYIVLANLKRNQYDLLKMLLECIFFCSFWYKFVTTKCKLRNAWF